MEKFSQNLLILISEKKKQNHRYSLRALARDLDIDQSNLSKILKGKRKPSVNQVVKLEKVLNPQLNSIA